MKVILRNDFHDSEAVVRTRGGRLTRRQVRRARRKLCGISTCTCGNAVGTRGLQRLPDGRLLQIEHDYDGGVTLLEGDTGERII